MATAKKEETPVDPSQLSPEELMLEIDNAQENIAAFEEHRMFKEYMRYKLAQETFAAILRERAVQIGDFRSKYFQFQKVEKEAIDWKAICRYLLDMKMVKVKDMEGAIQTFSETKPYGKMVKVKDRDLSLKLS